MNTSQNERLAIVTRVFTLFNILGMLWLQLHFLGLEGQGKMAWVSTAIVIFTQYSQWIGGGAMAFLMTRVSPKKLLFPVAAWIAFGELIFLALLFLFLDEPFQIWQWLTILALCSIQALFTAFQNMLLGKNRTRDYHTTILVQTSTTLIFTGIGLWIAPQISSVLAAMLLSFMITAGVSGKMIQDQIWPMETENWHTHLTDLFHHGKYVQGANTLLLILVRTPIYLIPYLSNGSFAMAGMYSILLYLSEGILLATKSFSVVQFAAICNTPSSTESWNITQKTLLKSVVVASILSIAWLVTPVQLLGVFMDAPWSDLKMTSYYFLPGIFLQSMSLIWLHLFSGTGYFRYNFHNAMVTFLAGIFSMMLLQKDLVGTAMSLTIAWTVQWCVYLLLVVRWRKLEQVH